MQINDRVENFTLQNQDEETVSLSDFADKPVILFFYPRANTSGCTIEACGFRDAFQKLQQAGAKRAVMLQVSAPFHCALMEPAQKALATDLEALVFNDPRFPIACNVDARLITRRAEARDCLVRQVTGSVRWVECIQLLIAQGITRFIEVGPGRVLTGLMRQIDRSQRTLNVEDSASLEKTIEALIAS